MGKVWITSDFHFGHENIIKYCDRPFNSLHEMNKTLTEEWNSKVSDNDTIYHVGDLFLGGFHYFDRYVKRLNGRIFLILGNHDKRWYRDCKKFAPEFLTKNISVHTEVSLNSDGFLTDKDEDKRFLLNHYLTCAIPKWFNKDSILFYGHVHGKVPFTEIGMDVGWDAHKRILSLEEAINIFNEHRSSIASKER